jgi:hypothetical protein
MNYNSAEVWKWRMGEVQRYNARGDLLKEYPKCTNDPQLF